MLRTFPLTTVGALVFDSKGLILIVKTTKWQGTWGIPGGKVEYGEPLEEALRREFLEEVNLNITQIRFALLQEAINDPQFHCQAHFIMVNYYAFSESNNVIPNEEIIEWAWVTPEQAFTYPLNTYTHTLIKNYYETQF
ncbi:MAG: NUDIX domain-containing protein [Microcystaceae cyanobacterium]